MKKVTKDLLELVGEEENQNGFGEEGEDDEKLPTVEEINSFEGPDDADIEAISDEDVESEFKKIASIMINTQDKDCADNELYLYYTLADQYPVLTREQEKDLISKYQNATDPEEKTSYRDTIIYSNIRLALCIATRYYNVLINPGFALSDAVQNGILGLMTALDRFDLSKGFKFSTYSIWWIRQSMTRYGRQEKSLMPKPDWFEEKRNLYTRILNRLESELNREPTDQEILEASNGNLLLKHINDIKLYTRKIVSLNAPVKDDADSGVLEDFVAGEDNVVKEINDIDRIDAINKVLSKSKPIQRRCIELYFGLNGEAEHTLDQTAQAVFKEGLLPHKTEAPSREYIRQVIGRWKSDVLKGSDAKFLKQFI